MSLDRWEEICQYYDFISEVSLLELKARHYNGPVSDSWQCMNFYLLDTVNLPPFTAMLLSPKPPLWNGSHAYIYYMNKIPHIIEAKARTYSDFWLIETYAWRHNQYTKDLLCIT